MSSGKLWPFCLGLNVLLTHWGRVTHICVSKLTVIGSDNDMSPVQRQAIIWTNAGILLIRALGTNFSEILGEIHSFSFSKIHLKMPSAKWRLFGLGLNELTRLVDISTNHHICGCRIILAKSGYLHSELAAATSLSLSLKPSCFGQMSKIYSATLGFENGWSPYRRHGFMGTNGNISVLRHKIISKSNSVEICLFT